MAEMLSIHSDHLKRRYIQRAVDVLREGGVIASGFDQKLDELRAISMDCQQFLDDLEQKEKEARQKYLPPQEDKLEVEYDW